MIVDKKMTGQLSEKAELLGLSAPVTVFESVSSTNDALCAAALEGAEHFTVFAAREQTAGKGRQGRTFFSPKGSGLYLSVLLRPSCTPEQALGLTPMAAVAAARMLESCAKIPVGIKWVNDLLCEDRKIVGILAESQYAADSDTLDFVILGIGVNLTPPPGGFPEDLRGIVGAAFPEGTDTERAFLECGAELLRTLHEEYEGFPQKRYLDGYKRRLCCLNRPVSVLENGIERRGVALDVDDDLRLLVRYEDGTSAWRGTGEIRIRL